MQGNRLYYRLKPLIPWRVRIALRRLSVRRTRRRQQDSWPISESAGRPPEGWPGWPGGKQFALVLTHDVEGPEGLKQVPELVKLEKRVGVRSSFNFIPEGPYVVPKELRDQVTRDGFEVGVHGLHHDGLLYSSREVFRRRAGQINRYLKEWGAVGFRSPFMQHDLEWIHDLCIQYDASTFDTDPFEPQPDGADTIFPFWVSGPDGKGYMELPYTLPQDFTLFVLFKERTLDTWKRKLDWVVQSGGMALMDVHPDYMAFGAGQQSMQQLSCERYQEFLEYVMGQYGDRCWHALPREVAEWCAAFRPKKRERSHKRICMITFSAYESDNRVMRYAETLAERGDAVDIVSLRRDRRSPGRERLHGVSVRRLQERGAKNQQSRGAYLLPILRFWFLSSLWLTWHHLRRGYDLIHVHNIPDFLVFAAWFPKLTGRRVILDIHDMVPEFYGSKFRVGTDRFGVRMLKRVEKTAARFADHVILSNHLWLDTFVARSAPKEKCSVFVNHVDTEVFFARERTRKDGRFILLFPGGLQWHQGLDIAIRAFDQIKADLPQAEFHLYGDGNMKDDLIALTEKLHLSDRVRFFAPRPMRDIAQIMANADLGVVPKRADSFGNEAYSTKIMEFMSLGVPVVVSRTKIDSYYFDDTMVRFFESGNVQALAEAILAVARDPSLREGMVAQARAYVARNCWSGKRGEYLDLVNSLTR